MNPQTRAAAEQAEMEAKLLEAAGMLAAEYGYTLDDLTEMLAANWDHVYGMPADWTPTGTEA